LETIEATRYCATQKKGPVYLKLGKAGEPRLTENAVDPFEIGKIRRVTAGNEIAILTYGPMIKQAFDVAEKLTAKGHSVAVFSVHTIKPLDREGIARALRDFKRVIVMEENVPHGALASRVKEIAWDTKATAELSVFTLQDKFIHCYGSHDELLDEHGISVERVVESVNAR